MLRKRASLSRSARSVKILDWHGLVKLLGEPAWATDPALEGLAPYFESGRVIGFIDHHGPDRDADGAQGLDDGATAPRVLGQLHRQRLAEDQRFGDDAIAHRGGADLDGATALDDVRAAPEADGEAHRDAGGQAYAALLATVLPQGAVQSALVGGATGMAQVGGAYMQALARQFAESIRANTVARNAPRPVKTKGAASPKCSASRPPGKGPMPTEKMNVPW